MTNFFIMLFRLQLPLNKIINMPYVSFLCQLYIGKMNKDESCNIPNINKTVFFYNA